MRASLLLALPLAACATTGMDAPSQTPGRCIADTGASLVGQGIARVSQGEIMRVTGAVTVRLVRPGQAVTMDYREDRATVQLDARERIVAIRCG